MTAAISSPRAGHRAWPAGTWHRRPQVQLRPGLSVCIAVDTTTVSAGSPRWAGWCPSSTRAPRTRSASRVWACRAHAGNTHTRMPYRPAGSARCRSSRRRRCPRSARRRSPQSSDGTGSDHAATSERRSAPRPARSPPDPARLRRAAPRRQPRAPQASAALSVRSGTRCDSIQVASRSNSSSTSRPPPGCRSPAWPSPAPLSAGRCRWAAARRHAGSPNWPDSSATGQHQAPARQRARFLRASGDRPGPCTSQNIITHSRTTRRARCNRDVGVLRLVGAQHLRRQRSARPAATWNVALRGAAPGQPPNT